MQKQIPTLLGLLLLLGALVAGLLFFGDGVGVFAPRATAEVTPKNIRITNLKDSGFSVSFFTEKKTAGFIKYGTDPSKLSLQVGDDRDQLSGSVGQFNLHHITLRGLNPATEYYFVIVTESKNEFDNEGKPFSIVTTSKISASMPEAVTIYGSVSNEGGTPAEGSIVYVSHSKMGDLSSLVKGSGSWAIPLSQAVLKDGSEYARLGNEEWLNFLVQGLSYDTSLQYRAQVKDAQPLTELSFGMKTEPIADNTDQASDSAEINPEFNEEPDVTASAPSTLADESLDENESEDETQSTISGRLQQMLEQADPVPQESTASSELALGANADEPVITTTTPVIRGSAPANIEVRINVHSETQYETTLTTNNDGSFELDLEELGLNLEPGEHTVSYNYIDPATGQEVSKTETFIVEDPNRVILAQANTPTSRSSSAIPSATPSPANAPYGTGSPYPMNTPTPKVTTSPVRPSVTASPATPPARKQPVGTDSALTKAGSIGTTALIALAGVFLMAMGSWSWWLASELDKEE